MENFFSLIFKNLASTTSWMLNKIFSLFERDESLLSKEAIELLSNPETRKEFIEFTSGSQKMDKTEDSNNNSSHKKTFELENGEKITFITYS